ncbi:MAG: CPXCG motif-containing cysteine-rich protein [Terrimicrobiaceae bacterium]|nr:CPXCG motif-containing cysteine-rich protein [Terrimicrobiaceae bacterium]
MDLVEDVEISCPHCGELFAISVETAFAESEFIEDCAVCCRPMRVFLRCRGGLVDSVETSPA